MIAEIEGKLGQTYASKPLFWVQWRVIQVDICHDGKTPFESDWLSPPGDTIADVLEERGWSQAEFAQWIGYTTKYVNQLLRGKASISKDTALRLERVLGSTARFWLHREAGYREGLARRVA